MRSPSNLTIAIAITVATIAVCSFGIRAELAASARIAGTHEQPGLAGEAQGRPVLSRGQAAEIAGKSNPRPQQNIAAPEQTM